MGDRPRRAAIAVIGAGWAGLSSAYRLAARGYQVTLFEASRQLGGRARRVDWLLPDGTAVALDNGQHILLGAYRETLELIELCAVSESDVLLRQPVHINRCDGFALRAWPLPAPWHVFFGLWAARGIGLRARLDAVRLMTRARLKRWRLPSDCSVASWLSEQDQSSEIIEKLWAPLCVAALNTPYQIASAQVFLNVLRDSLGARRYASDMLLPKMPLDAVLPNACAAAILALEGRIELGTRVDSLLVDPSAVELTSSSGGSWHFDGCVVAVSANQAVGLIQRLEGPGISELLACCASLSWQPITTVYFAYPSEVSLPAPMMALTEDLAQSQFGQWIFDKGQLGGPGGLLAVVISAQGPHQELDQGTIAQHVLTQLRQQLHLTATPVAYRVISEKRATFACVPELRRPPQRTPESRLVLAGDYTESDYPATLETAVASGRRAAALLEENLAGL
ncbi:MAG: hydroxysqualene dehydroxylase HpnE [Burkholderiaceae bacterium]